MIVDLLTMKNNKESCKNGDFRSKHKNREEKEQNLMASDTIFTSKCTSVACIKAFKLVITFNKVAKGSLKRYL
jgi:hypothetical protein